MASALKAMNLPPESKIALISKNCAHWLIADLAIMMAGFTSVPLYPNIGADTVNYILKHSGSKVLFVGKLDDWDGSKAGVPDDVTCIAFPEYGPDEPSYLQWNDLTAANEPMSGNRKPDPNEMFTIIYTSGTTGKPKGVMHRYHAIAFAASDALQLIDVNPTANGNYGGRFFSYLPLSHIAERLLVEMGSLYTGSEVFFAESLETFPKNLREASPTVFLGVPRIWTKFQMGVLQKMPQKKLNLLLAIPFISSMVKKKIRTQIGLNDAHHCFTGAAPTPPALITWWKKLGVEIQEVYGMTENCAYSHYTRKGKVKLGSTGQAMPNADVKISDIGEILVKSDASMIGYYKQPELTEAAFKDSYLRTGDKGVIDANGYLTITGRVKDIFKTEKGKYVAPVPIELKLSENTNVEQVCVVGVNLPQPMALVVLSQEARAKDKDEVEESLMETLKNLNPQLDKHEKLKKAVVVSDDWTVENELLTPTLKIKRGPVEDKYSPNYTRWYNEGSTVVWEG